MTPEAVRHLEMVDSVLGRVIERIGPCALRPKARRSPFESLARAVAHQQLHGRAATTILNRFRALFPGKRFPRPADLASVSDEQLRHCGFSRAKIASIRDIADKSLGGQIPTSRAIARLPDDQIVECLIEVRGVGRWTAEMLLIFQLGRPDVLPADDYGIRNGFRLTYGRSSLPHPKEVLAHGECWRPHRTTASWYLWRALEIPSFHPPIRAVS